MIIDPILKVFWILVAFILLTNAAWLLYASFLEDEIALIYKIIEGKPLKRKDRKKINKIERRIKKNAKRNRL